VDTSSGKAPQTLPHQFLAAHRFSQVLEVDNKISLCFSSFSCCDFYFVKEFSSFQIWRHCQLIAKLLINADFTKQRIGQFVSSDP